MKFVDVTNDVAFRKIFGNENRKEVLISFLNAVLLLEGERWITDVEMLTPFQLPALQRGKVTIVDVRARDQRGNSYIVEMQVADMKDIDKRVLYYASKSYSAQLESGDAYERLNPVFFIGILEFEATQNPNYISRHRVLDVETGENLITDIEFTFIELPKFNKPEAQLTSIIDQWLYFLKNAVDLKMIPESVNDKGLISAYEDADKHSWTKEELWAYDNIFLREADEKAKMAKALEKAEQRLQENIAANLLKMGIPVDEVAKGVGLNIGVIQKIWEKLNM